MKPYLLSACAIALAVPATHATAQQSETAQAERVVVEGEPLDPVEEAGTVDLGGAQPPGGGTTTESVISYAPDYFAPYNPTNAWDMVNRVPGFSAQSGGSARGFGQNAGNVLINGERPSAKSQNASDILQRIPVSEIVRIDLIRGQVAGIDMSGQTVVVNVIRRVSLRSSGTWRVQANYNSVSGETKLNGEVSRNFTFLGANITAGLNINSFPQGQMRREIVLAPDGTALQQSLNRSRGGPESWQINFNADRPIGEWMLRLNGRFSDGGFESDDYQRYVGGLRRLRLAYRTVQVNGEEILVPEYRFPEEPYLRYDLEEGRFDNDETQWELGGDLERDLSSDLTLKIIALQSMETQDQVSLFSVYDPAGHVSTSSFARQNESGESILRSFVTWNASSTVSVEAGAEVAYNYLDTERTITEDTGAGPVVIPLAINDTKVEEIRGEPYVTMLWRPRQGLAFDASFQAEVSEIKQSGDASQTRNFFYPKGAASMTWDVRDNTQLRFGVERTVGQLSFDDFASSVSFGDSTQNSGNPDLVPEQTWTARATLEQRFWDDGVFTVEFTRDWITDAQGLIPVQTPFGWTDAAGNLGDADRWQIELSVDAPLDRIGLTDARVNAGYEYGDSEVVDPVTGEVRVLPSGGGFFFGGGRQGYDFGFRQDYPEAAVSWGFNFFRNSGSYSYRINEVQFVDPQQNSIEAFVETTRFFGVNIRLQVNNIGNNYTDRHRFRFFGPRDTAPLAVTEWRRQYDDVVVNLRVRGTF